ncbi:MAG: response regulator, partial [Candidatus Zixiibacteriota bacterium]
QSTKMAKREILIVDDNPNMASLLSEMLDVYDVKSRVTNDGESALKLLDEEQFALVITDLKMPKMSGAELLAAIKGRHPETPVVVISGYNVGTSEGQVVSGLANGFIHKPFKMIDIQSVVEQFL